VNSQMIAGFTIICLHGVG